MSINARFNTTVAFSGFVKKRWFLMLYNQLVIILLHIFKTFVTTYAADFHTYAITLNFFYICSVE